MANSVPLALYVDDADESYFEWRKQAIDVHLELGTQRLDEPVSRTTLNCGHSQECFGTTSRGMVRTV